MIPISNAFTSRTLLRGMRSTDSANRLIGVKNTGHWGGGRRRMMISFEISVDFEVFGSGVFDKSV